MPLLYTRSGKWQNVQCATPCIYQTEYAWNMHIRNNQQSYFLLKLALARKKSLNLDQRKNWN